MEKILPFLKLFLECKLVLIKFFIFEADFVFFLFFFLGVKGFRGASLMCEPAVKDKLLLIEGTWQMFKEKSRKVALPINKKKLSSFDRFKKSKYPIFMTLSLM